MNTIKNELLLMKLFPEENIEEIEEAKKQKEPQQNMKAIKTEYINISELRLKNPDYHKDLPDVKPSCLFNGWVAYLIVMIGGLIFRGYVAIAIIATIYFFSWRHNKIEEANGRKYHH